MTRVVPIIKATILFFAIIVGLAIVIQGHLSTVQELPREPQTLFQKTMKPSAGAQTGVLKINLTPTKAFLAGDILTAQVEVDIFGISWRENETCMVEMVFPDALCYVDSWSNSTRQDWTFTWWEYQTHDAVYAIYQKNVTLWYVHDGFYGVNVTVWNPRFGSNEYHFSDLIQIKPYSSLEEKRRDVLAEALNTEIFGLTIITVGPVFVQVVDSVKESSAKRARVRKIPITSEASDKEKVSSDQTRGDYRKELLDVDVRKRIDKLDTLFLWVASLSGVGFSVLVSYKEIGLPIELYFPVFCFVAFSLTIGYVSGAAFLNSFTERLRGWNYLLIGSMMYWPFALVKWAEPYLGAQFTFNVQSSLGLLVPLVYTFVSYRFITPRIFKSFGFDMGDVTRRILQKTLIAAIELGSILYVAFLYINQIRTNQGPQLNLLLLYLAGLFGTALIMQEVSVRPLLKLEEFQRFVKLELKIRKKAIIMCGILLIPSIIVLSLAANSPDIIISSFGSLTFSVVFASFMIAFAALILVMFAVDKGTGVSIRQSAEKELSTAKLKELEELVSKVDKTVKQKNQSDSAQGGPAQHEHRS